MAEPITIARPYARAAFESALGAKALSPWGRFLARAAVLVRDPRLEALIGNPRMKAADLVQLMLELATSEGEPGESAGADSSGATAAHLIESQRNLLELLAHNRRLLLLPEVAAQYESLRAEAEHIADVDVLSARELTADQSSKLQTALEHRLGRKVRLHARVDQGLLGGAIVHYGDYVFDGSLRRRVERLASALSGA